MPVTLYADQSAIAEVWQEFIRSGQILTGSIRPEILNSWHRCQAFGVDPEDGVSHQLLSDDEIYLLLGRHKAYLDIVRHFMKRLYEFVKGSGFIVMLADERGYVMENLGDSATLELAARVNLIKGACWTEEEGGTNGIGIALALKKPFQVSGREHFCRKLHTWTCSAAPFFAESGELIGALQMSGPASETHQHTLGMVVAAVEAISYQIRVRSRNSDLSVLNDRLNNIFQTMSDGAIIIDQAGAITQINPVAKKFLGAGILGRSIDELIGADTALLKFIQAGRTYKDQEIILETAYGDIHALVTVKPVSNEFGELTGGVIFFNPINKMKKLVNRFGGAQATFSFSDLVGRHETFKKALRLAERAAGNTSHVLLQGESGTGKELLAQAIHNRSLRRKGPFLALNCASLPRDLIASELFGYASGAFTGANPKGRPGKFEMAAGGTLFLDEIGDMPLDQQASLLRVLQDKQITRLGSDRVISVDVRVICATNRDLREEVAKGNFRKDLYYRLNVILIQVPALRERGDDVLFLFDYFLQKIAGKLNLAVSQVDSAVRDCLRAYSWPGNVRELENVVEKMLNLAEAGRISIAHLPAEILAHVGSVAAVPAPAGASDNPDKNYKQMLGESERRILLDLLQDHHGNVSRIARAMGVSRNTIYRKMRHHEISKDYLFD